MSSISALRLGAPEAVEISTRLSYIRRATGWLSTYGLTCIYKGWPTSMNGDTDIMLRRDDGTVWVWQMDGHQVDSITQISNAPQTGTSFSNPRR